MKHTSILILCLITTISYAQKSEQYVVKNNGDTIRFKKNATTLLTPIGITRLKMADKTKVDVKTDEIKCMNVKVRGELCMRYNMVKESGNKEFMSLLLDANDYQMYTNESVSYSSAAGAPVGSQSYIRIYKNEKFIDRVRGENKEEILKKYFGPCAVELLKKCDEKVSWAGNIADMASRYHEECE